MKKTVVVLGGGITGLTSSYVLLKKGYDVLLLEKKDCIGGLCATFPYKDYLLDYGPHNFHTDIEGVLPFVKDELKISLNRIMISSSKLLFMGKLIDYPLKIMNALKNLSLKEALLTFVDYFVNRLMVRLGLRKAIDDSFESWIVNRFGKRLYGLYFGPYAQKVWGLPGYEIDMTVAVKKIPEPSLLSLIIRTLTGIKSGNYHSEDPSVITSYYPPKGIGTISDALKDRIKELGGTIELNSKVEELSITKKTIKYRSGNNLKEFAWDYIINTTPLDTFLPVVKEKDYLIAKSAKNLHYRAIVFLYIITNMEKVFDYPWIYFNDRDNKELIFNRIYEISNFSKEMVNSKKGVICIEITCYKDDDIWEKSDEALFNQCISYLEKYKFMKKDTAESYFTRRVDTVYPVFKKGFRTDLINIINYLASNDIFCLGRQGLFSYANMDHCIDMGLKLEKLFKDQDSAKVEYLDIYKAYIN